MMDEGRGAPSGSSRIYDCELAEIECSQLRPGLGEVAVKPACNCPFPLPTSACLRKNEPHHLTTGRGMAVCDIANCMLAVYESRNARTRLRRITTKATACQAPLFSRKTKTGITVMELDNVAAD
jgi:hypothetical protein